MGIVKVNPLAALAAESTESAVTSRTKDGLCGVAHEVGNSKTIPTLVIKMTVVPQLALVALPIGMATAPTVMV
jgi:hypothetical protein